MAGSMEDSTEIFRLSHTLTVMSQYTHSDMSQDLSLSVVRV